MTTKNQSPFTIVEHSGHRFIYHRGNLIYKQYLHHREPSVLFGQNGWPNTRVV